MKKNRSIVYFRLHALSFGLLFLLVPAIMVSGQPAPVVASDSSGRMNPVNDTIHHATIDSAASPAESQLLPVSADMLFGLWKGKDSSGSDLSFSFTRPAQEQPFIYSVAVRFGKSTVMGRCTLMENNLHELMLSTTEIQDIRTMWSMKYDGAFLTITDIGGHVFGGLNTFRLIKKSGE